MNQLKQLYSIQYLFHTETVIPSEKINTSTDGTAVTHVTFPNVVQCEKDIVLDRLISIQKEICNNSILSDMGVTLSIGVAFSYENDKLNDLIERADIALYQSKLLGKNEICVYN